MDKLLTAREVAEVLGCHEQTIYKWKDLGKIPYIRKNGLIRFRKTEIEDWIEQGSERVDSLTESLTQVDLPLVAYDKLFLKGETMSQTGKTWTYPFGSVYLRQNKSGKERWYIYYRIEGKRVRKVVKGAQSRSDALKVLQVEVADAENQLGGLSRAVAVQDLLQGVVAEAHLVADLIRDATQQIALFVEPRDRAVDSDLLAEVFADGGHHGAEAALGGGDLDGEVDNRHVPGRHVYDLGRPAEELEPLLRLERQLDLLARFQVVEHRHRHGYLVALSQGQRQVDLHEKVLEDADGGRG